jgi:hypothetical protein
MNIYPVGNAVLLKVVFQEDNVPVDPTGIKLRLIDPAGTEVDYTYGAAELTKISAGIYEKQIEANTPGIWKYRFEGTGIIYAAKESQFLVTASVFNNPQ